MGREEVWVSRRRCFCGDIVDTRVFNSLESAQYGWWMLNSIASLVLNEVSAGDGSVE